MTPGVIRPFAVSYSFPVELTSTGKVDSKPDPELGYALDGGVSQGVMRLPWLEQEMAFTYTVGKGGYRATSKEDVESVARSGAVAASEARSILCAGCSFTYGGLLDDEKTYPWLLQLANPGNKVLNIGVQGYGMCQTFLQLKRLLPALKPEVVVLGFHFDLPHRNTLSLRFRTACPGHKFPFAISSGGKLRIYEPRGVESLPLSGSLRLAALLENAINAVAYRRRNDPAVIRQTTEHLLLATRKLCEKHGAHFLVACLGNTGEYHDFLKAWAFNWCHTEVDLRGRARWTLYPFDSHPNEEANRAWARAISRAVGEIREKGFSSPPFARRGERQGGQDLTREIYTLF